MLNSYVQRMLDYDLIRYDSTCLILTFYEQNNNIIINNKDDKKNLEEKLRYQIETLMKESNNEGISLAQLPMMLNQK